MVDVKLFSVILGSVTLSASAQLTLKVGMSHGTVQRILAEGVSLSLLPVVFGNPYVLLGFLLYVLAAVTWLLVLGTVDVSFAYPFVGLGFLMTMLFASLFLHEEVGPLRFVGTLLVAFGCALVSWSH